MSETKHTPLPWRSVIISAYRDGFKEGIRLFAWWKDGVQQVGTTGTTFKEAIAKDIPAEVDCDAYLTEAAKQEVAVRPKVEELVKVGLYQTRWEDIFNRLLACAGMAGIGPGDKYINELRALRFMLREVEAALKETVL